MNISWSIWFYFESKHDIIQRKSKIPWPTFIEIRSPSSINMEVNVLFTVLWYCLQKKCKNLFNADFNFYHLLSKILLYWKWLLILETFCNKSGLINRSQALSQQNQWLCALKTEIIWMKNWLNIATQVKDNGFHIDLIWLLLTSYW